MASSSSQGVTDDGLAGNDGLSCVEEMRLLKRLKTDGLGQDELCRLLTSDFHITDASRAKDIVSRLVELGLVAPKEKRSKTEMLDNDDNPLAGKADDATFVLNRRRLSAAPKPKAPVCATELAIRLRKQIMALYGKFLMADGTGVDYAGAAQSRELVEYGQIAELLMFVDVSRLEESISSENERKALFFNLYNALVIHGHIALGNPTNVPERGVFFTKTAYDVGGELWTLDVIEHGFLRCNRRKPFATVPLLHVESDSRARHALAEPVDPRLHFALNCGAKSCPPVRFYTAEKLDDQLNLAARGFLNDDANLKIDLTDRLVTLTKLLDWYGFDFGGNHREVLLCILPFLKDEKHEKLKALLDSSDPIRVEFYAYDWTENGA